MFAVSASEKIEFSILVTGGLGFAVTAEALSLHFLLGALAAGLIGKLGGAGLPAYLMGRPRGDALAIGRCMNVRGAVGLIVADIALRQGLFNHPQPVPAAVANPFSAVVLMALSTTLLTPIALRRVLKD